MSTTARFKKLIPFGLCWGFATGIVVHFVGTGGAGPSYWLIFIAVWALSGLLWAYLLARFTKPKSKSNAIKREEIS